MPNEFIKFVDEDESTPSTSDGDLGTLARKILIVDDDEDTHIMTVLLLKDFVMDNHSIELIHAYSGQEAYQILQQQPDIVVMLLDVVMESSLAGLDLVKKIRKELPFEKLRIILRTGQPGYAPELETIRKYDINDYQSKTELTRERLHGCFITALRSYEQLERLENLAYVDPLTNLYNRNGLLRLLCYYNDNQDKDYSLVVIGLQQFSALVESFGPLHEDKYLKAFADKLLSFKGIYVQSRLWGNDFAFIVDTHAVKLPLLLDKLKAPLHINNRTHKISFYTGSVGLDSKISSSELISHATIALQQAKQVGIAQHALSTNPIAEDIPNRAAMLALLQEDFQAERLYLLYQPQIDVNSATLTGFEALVRWQDSSGNLTPPEVFIELAESSGLILELGEWILKKALQESKPFFLTNPSLRVGVNISVIQFLKDNFVTMVQNALTEQEVSGNNLTLEITESIGFLGTEAIKLKIKTLQSLGIHVSIDDFGTGFSNLSYLNHLSIDSLKIDRSFINRLDSNSGKQIVEMIINLGRKLDLHLIAEGVETEEQQRQLLRMGCNEAQGYLHAHPLSAQQLQKWLEEHTPPL